MITKPRCEIEDVCSRKAAFILIGRDITGTEIGHVLCCFYHGMRIVNINHDILHCIPDCVVTPIETPIEDSEDVTV